MSETGTALLAVGALGVAGYVLWRSPQALGPVGPSGPASPSGIVGAGGSSGALPNDSTRPERTASSGTLPAMPAVSVRWGRVIRDPQPWAPGMVTTVVTSGGGTGVATQSYYDAATSSAIWEFQGKRFAIPWDTNPDDYVWAAGVGPLGADTGRTTAGDGAAVAAQLDARWDITDNVTAFAKEQFNELVGGAGSTSDRLWHWLEERIKW